MHSCTVCRTRFVELACYERLCPPCKRVALVEALAITSDEVIRDDIAAQLAAIDWRIMASGMTQIQKEQERDRRDAARRRLDEQDEAEARQLQKWMLS